MYVNKQISPEEINTKTIVLNFIPSHHGIGTKTYLFNTASLYSKTNPNKLCLIMDLKNELKNLFEEEKKINNIKVKYNENFPNLLYLNMSTLKEKTEDNSLMRVLTSKLNLDVIFVKNNLISESLHFLHIDSHKYLKKTYLLTDLDSDNTLNLYKELVFNPIKNNGTVVLNCQKNDGFKFKKFDKLLEIKKYTKIIAKSNNYSIIEYAKNKNTTLFKDISFINETDIFLEYQDNLNILLGKPIKGFGRQWIKKNV